MKFFLNFSYNFLSAQCTITSNTVRASYNSQNMKFRICHDIVVVCEYVRVFAQIIQQINTTSFSHIFKQLSSNFNKHHVMILA